MKGVHTLAVRSIALFAAILLTAVACETEPRATPVDGSLAQCQDFTLLGIKDIDEGWVWVDSRHPIQQVHGLVIDSFVATTDFPAMHDSHDQNARVEVRRSDTDLLSDVNWPNNTDDVGDSSGLLGPTAMQIEWETGTFPSERGPHAPERTFPRWAWPSIGDEVWAEGHWIFDCGHPKKVGGTPHYKTEIHPPYALASIRQQVRAVPGSNGALLPVTGVDLYIHGQAGFAPDVLYCGADVVVGIIDSCPTHSTPIDKNFEFMVPLPLKISDDAELVTLVEQRPGNTIAIDPILSGPSSTNTMTVRVPLAGTGVRPEGVYGRTIYAGWLDPRTPPVRRFRFTLTKIILHDDKDPLAGDCECTFWYLNLNRALDAEWTRLVDHADGNMNSYDDDNGFGNGEITFSGASVDFAVRQGQSFSVRLRGYDQDCMDGYFGDHALHLSDYVNCWYGRGLFGLERGAGDELDHFDATFDPPDYGVGIQRMPAGDDYDVEFTIEEMPAS
jgi:hypothetical protein